MSDQQEQGAFIEWLRSRHVGIESQTISAASANSARWLSDGTKLGIANLKTGATLKKAQTNGVPWALVSKFFIPEAGGGELHFALVLSGANLDELVRRVDSFGDKGTNNTRFVLCRDGLFVTTAKETEAIGEAIANGAYGPPVPFDELLYADTRRQGHLSRGEVDAITWIRSNAPHPDSIVRLEPAGTAAPRSRFPNEIGFVELSMAIRELGGTYSEDQLASFHLAMIHNPKKHFVILRGISGTGKSRLAKAYAHAVLGRPSLSGQHERFVVVPVEPHWTDPTFLVGIEDLTSAKGYAETPFLRALLLADSDPLQPVFVLLDEMNRAQVEHYFATFLSAMELESDIVFHDSEEIGIAGIPRRIRWPRNLYLVGTVNDDESVIPFSPMVLDRANTLDLSDVDIRTFCSDLLTREPELGLVITDELTLLLERLTDALSPQGLHFGYRTVEEMALYLKAAVGSGVTSNALDAQIDQKILPKLRGGDESSDTLARVEGLLNSQAHPRSLQRVRQMRADLQNLGFFKYR